MLFNGKANINKTFGYLSIVIPSKKNWFNLIFGAFWLCGWLFGFLTTSGVLLRGDSNGASGFLSFWLLMWTLGGITVISLMLWGWFGKETFIADGREVLFEKTVFGVGLKKKLVQSEIKNFRFEYIETGWFSGGRSRWSSWGLGPGKIKFDYGLKTYSFGLGVDDAEAHHIIQLLNEEYSNRS